MYTEKRSSEHKDNYLQRMKPCSDNTSKAFTGSFVLKRHRTRTNAYPIKYTTMNKCFSTPIRRQSKASHRRFQSLLDDIHMQLDSKLIEDSKDHSWMKKYRERAKVYMHDLYKIGCAKFTIDSRDLNDVAKSILYKLDGHSAEYVIRQVVNRIFASVGILDSKLKPRYCML